MAINHNDIEGLARAFNRSHGNLINYRHILLDNDAKIVVAPALFHQSWSDSLLFGLENEAIESFRESAKALPLDTEIPTPTGFKPIAEIGKGNYVFDMDGNKAKVLSVSKTFYREEFFRVTFDDGTSLDCSGDHLWYVNDKRKRKQRSVKTNEMFMDYLG